MIDSLLVFFGGPIIVQVRGLLYKWSESLSRRFPGFGVDADFYDWESSAP